jgi:RNA polymerase sigma factor (sigma-70 family)
VADIDISILRSSEAAPDEAKWLAAYQRTRKSLIERLTNWRDQKAWDEFYKTYWRLIYSVGLKSGLRADEAMDTVQEVVLSIAKQTAKCQYDPAQGSFKAWLMNLTRWRINDQFRKRAKDTAMLHGREGDDRDTAIIDRVADPDGLHLERVWDAEWAKNITDQALARVKLKVTPLKYQLFDAYVIREWSVPRIISEMGVTRTQIYLAKHRVHKMLKRELIDLEKIQRFPPPAKR